MVDTKQRHTQAGEARASLEQSFLGVGVSRSAPVGERGLSVRSLSARDALSFLQHRLPSSPNGLGHMVNPSFPEHKLGLHFHHGGCGDVDSVYWGSLARVDCYYLAMLRDVGDFLLREVVVLDVPLVVFAKSPLGQKGVRLGLLRDGAGCHHRCCCC